MGNRNRDGEVCRQLRNALSRALATATSVSGDCGGGVALDNHGPMVWNNEPEVDGRFGMGSFAKLQQTLDRKLAAMCPVVADNVAVAWLAAAVQVSHPVVKKHYVLADAELTVLGGGAALPMNQEPRHWAEFTVTLTDQLSSLVTAETIKYFY